MSGRPYKYAARYIQDSSSGQFASKTNGGQNIAPVARGTHAYSSDLQSATSFQIEDLGSMSPQSKTSGPHKANRTQISVLSEHAKPESCTSSQITQLVEAINGVTGLMSESKGVLDNMNRVLIAIQRSQVMVSTVPCQARVYKQFTIQQVREWSSYDHVRSNPVNDQGVTAVVRSTFEPMIEFDAVYLFRSGACLDYVLPTLEIHALTTH
jgi:hypothetical protein